MGKTIFSNSKVLLSIIALVALPSTHSQAANSAGGECVDIPPGTSPLDAIPADACAQYSSPNGMAPYLVGIGMDANCKAGQIRYACSTSDFVFRTNGGSAVGSNSALDRRDLAGALERLDQTAAGETVFIDRSTNRLYVGAGCASLGNFKCRELLVSRPDGSTGNATEQDLAAAAKYKAPGESRSKSDFVGRDELKQPESSAYVAKKADGSADGSTGGAAGSNSGGTNSASTKVVGKTTRNDEHDSRDKLGLDPNCEVSSGLGDNYSCKKTRDLVDNSKIVNQLGQTAGAIGVGVQGAAAQQSAFSAGTQSAALEGAAKTQKFGAGAQALGGAVNVVMGAMQMRAGSRHKGNEADFTRSIKEESYKLNGSTVVSTRGDNSAGGRILSQYEVGQDFVQPNASDPKYANNKAQYDEDLKAYRTAVAKKAGGYAKKGAIEQSTVRGEANQGAFLSMVTGAQQLGNAALGYMSAKQMEEAARKLKEAEGKTTGSPIAPPGMDSFPGGDSASGATTITGDGSNPDQSSALADAGITSGNGADDLGEGFDPRGNAGGPTAAGPAPGAFKEGGGGGGAGGGPAGGVGSATTSAAQGGSQDDPQPRLAHQGAAVGFESGRGGGYAGGGGGGNGGGGSDLSSLLAQFLPKKEEEDKPKNGILDFGGRGPAGEQPLSLLDRNTNIFQRIHETYGEKTRTGRVGL